MQLPIKAHYAALAMLCLADVHARGGRLGTKQIAQQHEIPVQFLAQILQQLRAAGLIHSVRGAQGGFMLARPPQQITLAEIVDAICATPNETARRGPAEGLSVALHDVWQQLEDAQRQVLESYTLARLLEQATSSPTMFYI
ncbi:MAG: Rrf2 family transcriptional regulator [Pirellulaceae bacterium]|nr:MAG: Rrf2 family transcriptional regulator [Pirellulaceae bacterium]